MHPLYSNFCRHIDLSRDQFQEIVEHFKPKSFRKNDLVVSEGRSVTEQFFVVKGALRTYLLDRDGKEHTIQFAIENWWASDYIAYYKEVESMLFVECIEPSELLSIHKSKLQELFVIYPALERFFRIQLENAFVSFQKRILSNLHMTAQERYSNFLDRYPDIEQRVKNYHIASYLGITSESLSRLRKLRNQ